TARNCGAATFEIVRIRIRFSRIATRTLPGVRILIGHGTTGTEPLAILTVGTTPGTVAVDRWIEARTRDIRIAATLRWLVGISLSSFCSGSILSGCGRRRPSDESERGGDAQRGQKTARKFHELAP